MRYFLIVPQLSAAFGDNGDSRDIAGTCPSSDSGTSSGTFVGLPPLGGTHMSRCPDPSDFCERSSALLKWKPNTFAKLFAAAYGAKFWCRPSLPSANYEIAASDQIWSACKNRLLQTVLCPASS